MYCQSTAGSGNNGFRGGILADLATNFWTSKQDIIDNWKLEHNFTPLMEETKRQELLSGWDKAIRFTLMWKDV